jgi:hypothetical protein
MSLTYSPRAQGAIEYLLIIGAALLVVVIVIIAMSAIAASGKDTVGDGNSTLTTVYDQLKRIDDSNPSSPFSLCANPYCLALNLSGSGSVVASPAGSNYGSGSSYAVGFSSIVSTLTLTATPQSGYSTSWSGCTVDVNPNVCTLNLDSNKTVSVTFNPPAPTTVLLTVGIPTNGTITGAGINCGSDCEEQIDVGTSITLTATPNTGATFNSWSGCTSVSGNVCTVLMNSAKSVSATFNPPVSSYLLTVASSAMGVISTAVLDINCGALCSKNYSSGSSVVLTATPNAGYTFGSWSGCTSVSGNVCTVLMNSAKSVSATFNQVSYLLTVTPPINGVISTAVLDINCGALCSKNFTSGTNVTLTATPFAGYVFGSWTGCTTTTGNSCTVGMTSAKTVSATFNLSGLSLTGLKAYYKLDGNFIDASGVGNNGRIPSDTLIGSSLVNDTPYAPYFGYYDEDGNHYSISEELGYYADYSMYYVKFNSGALNGNTFSISDAYYSCWDYWPCMTFTSEDLPSSGDKFSVYKYAEGSAPSFVTGKLGQGAQFNGSTSQLGLGTGVSGSFDISNEATYTAWVKLNGPGKGHILNKWVSGQEDKALYFDSSGRILISIFDGGYSMVSSPTALETTQWHFIVGTYSAAGTKIYTDGNMVNSSSDTGALNSSGEMFMGNNLSRSDWTTGFAGTLDEVSIWNRALTQSEITFLYNSGAGRSIK